MYRDLTQGNVTKTLLLFSLPMIAGNLLQQCYNIADTLIVGQFLGSNALAAVGSAYTLMTFLTSVLLGLSMGAGALFSIYQGQGDRDRLGRAVSNAFFLIFLITLALNACVYLWTDPILTFLQVPGDVYPLMRDYVVVIFAGLFATFLYNFFACLLRAIGNSAVPLGLSGGKRPAEHRPGPVLRAGHPLGGWRGAALATVLSQYVAGVGIALYTWRKCPQLRPARNQLRPQGRMLREICSLSLLTCVQQSIMNFGILLVQGLVNSFGPVIMAAFAAAVKIDSFAYMPVQDFGNAFSTFVAQNYGAGKKDRIRSGIRRAVLLAFGFCAVVSTAVILFAKPLMLLFVQPQETEILAEGVWYLQVVAAFYWGIGLLFLLYGYYRAVKRPGMSVVLTVISLGTRVVLAYLLSGPVGVTGIWAAIPIGWGPGGLDRRGVLYLPAAAGRGEGPVERK